MDLMSLMIRIGADISGAQQGISEVNSGVESVGKGAEKISPKLQKVGKLLKTAFSVVAIKKVVDGFISLATSAASTADHIDKMSQKIGISREAYQELDFVLSQSGTSVDNLQAGMKTLRSQMDKVASGNKDSAATFKKLGIEVKNADGSMRSQEEVLFDTIAALQGVDDETEKARLATELFGKSGLELMPLLNGASGSMEEMRQKAHDLGLVMGDDAIDAGVKLNDTIDQVKRAFSAITTQIGVEVMPIIQKVLDWVIAHMPEIREVVSTAFKVIGVVVNEVVNFIKVYLVPVFEGLVRFVKGVFAGDWKEAWEGIKDAFTAIWKGISEWFKSKFELAKNRIAAIDWAQLGKDILDGIKGAFKKVITWFRDKFKLVKERIAKIDWAKLGKDIWSDIKDSFKKVATWFEDKFKLVKERIANVV